MMHNKQPYSFEKTEERGKKKNKKMIFEITHNVLQLNAAERSGVAI